MVISPKPVSQYFEKKLNAKLFLNSLQQCYQNPTEIFTRIITVNDTVFVMTDADNIIGYLFYSDKEVLQVEINQVVTKAIYNGYALINEQYRKTGALKELLLYSNTFYKLKYEKEYSQLLFYAVTSNPIAMRSYYKVFYTVKPQPNMPITENEILIAVRLKEHLFIKAEPNEHPFTFTTILPQRYNDRMRNVFSNSKLKEVTLLDELGINEKDGDRLLFYWTELTKKEELSDGCHRHYSHKNHVETVR